MNPSATSGTARQRKLGGRRGAVGSLDKITALFYLQLRLKKREIISKEIVQFI